MAILLKVFFPVILLVGGVIAILVLSLVNTIWFRLAAQWLQIGKLPYLAALKAVFVSTFTIAACNFLIGFGEGYAMQVMRQLSGTRAGNVADMTLGFSPTYFLYNAVFGLCIQAALFRCTLPQPEGKPALSFSDAFALSTFFTAISIMFWAVLAVAALTVVNSIMLVL